MWYSNIGKIDTVLLNQKFCFWEANITNVYWKNIFFEKSVKIFTPLNQVIKCPSQSVTSLVASLSTNKISIDVLIYSNYLLILYIKNKSYSYTNIFYIFCPERKETSWACRTWNTNSENGSSRGVSTATRSGLLGTLIRRCSHSIAWADFSSISMLEERLMPFQTQGL